MRDYKKLEVWNMAVDLSVEVYQATSVFPKSELYGITSQIQRAVISIPSNISEGVGRETEKQFSQYLHFAYGFACELETQLIIANRLEHLSDDSFNSITEKLIHLQKKIFNLNKLLNKQS
ncbi:MAG: hypothetical protein BGO32_12325 [Bacteroidetes bacterium 37-13]|nr:MAG: hypothetical protein BGO32_12325 [Bacteroidetes bacterium 37-13]